MSVKVKRFRFLEHLAVNWIAGSHLIVLQRLRRSIGEMVPNLSVVRSAGLIEVVREGWKLDLNINPVAPLLRFPHRCIATKNTFP